MTGLEVFGVQVASKLTNMAVNRILDGLIERQNQTVALLKDLSRDVQAQLHGPHRTALLYIEEAATPGRSVADRNEKLSLAIQELMRALGQEHEPAIKADVHMTLALVDWAVQRPIDAQRHSAIANQFFIEALEAAVAEHNQKWRRKRLLLKLAATGGAISQDEKGKKKIVQTFSSLKTICDRGCEAAYFSRALGGEIRESRLINLEYIPERIVVRMRGGGWGAGGKIPVPVSKAPPQMTVVIFSE